MIGPPPPVTDISGNFISLSSVSPSFTGNSSNNLADIAARVVEEFRNENRHDNDENVDYDDIYSFNDESEGNRTENLNDNLNYDVNQYYNDVDDKLKVNSTDNLKENEADVVDKFSYDVNRDYVHVDDELKVNRTENLKKSEEEVDDDGEFEFAVSADQILFNGEIVHRYPLFDRSLLLDDVTVKSDGYSKPDLASPALLPAVRQPLRKLFIEERETASCMSSSSSESDDLDGVSPETYCIWKPKPESSPESCQKSNSTGNTSKRWKFRNLLYRSNSDVNVKNSPVIVFDPLTKRSEKVKKVEKSSKVAGADDDGEPTPTPTSAPATVTVETNFSNSSNKTKSEGNRVKSYLPYKPDLVGVFANVNGLNRKLHPF